MLSEYYQVFIELRDNLCYMYTLSKFYKNEIGKYLKKT